MPIRTNRGRAAVYRRLWGWPLRSTAHLTVSLVVLAVLLIAAGVVVPKLVGEQPQRTGRAGEISVTPDDGKAGPPPNRASSGPLPTRLSEPRESPTSAPPNGDAMRVAEQFAAAWVNHPDGITNEQWLAGLKPFTTDEFLPTMSTVDPANIPATRVTGQPVPVNSLTSSLEAEVPTDGPKLSITVVSTNVGWRVSALDQAG
ncbi:hypothetical protein [Amycolatopsis albispora]|uniref:Uncharacterized protein n=1 Tax=Amycolatopsis albispora TaxID=1804986 RepID=A0A344LGP2_9PSEU|nr:hypothetical protein [Amycolatopsis albispora]AXB47216.1 hypothetical protein A4R43_36170 [Amycolatopsis albispora]